MTKFTTRVELLNADSEDYDALHQEMENRGFSRTITNDEGEEYYLPPAEYNREGSFTLDQTADAARAAAVATGKENRVLVTESNGRIWINLLPVIK
jgi:hypothetical protein